MYVYDVQRDQPLLFKPSRYENASAISQTYSIEPCLPAQRHKADSPYLPLSSTPPTPTPTPTPPPPLLPLPPLLIPLLLRPFPPIPLLLLTSSIKLRMPCDSLQKINRIKPRHRRLRIRFLPATQQLPIPQRSNGYAYRGGDCYPLRFLAFPASWLETAADCFDSAGHRGGFGGFEEGVGFAGFVGVFLGRYTWGWLVFARTAAGADC